MPPAGQVIRSRPARRRRLVDRQRSLLSSGDKLLKLGHEFFLPFWR